MAAEVAQLLVTDPDGCYLDLTVGGGGHLRALAGRLGSGARLYGIDRDSEAVARSALALEETVQLRKIVKATFGDLAEAVGQFEESLFSGILLDLGLSSYQLEDPSRGFSFRHDGPLDMRFDPTTGISATDLIGSLDEKRLTKLIREYGEERQTARIAKAIVRERQKEVIDTTGRLADIIVSVIRSPHQTKVLARVFQAIRIAVNRELDELQRVLPAALEVLSSGGRLAVIAYHSLEDRIVKRFYQQEARGRCICPPGLPVCSCGSQPTMRIITRKGVAPRAEEISQNPRARSARLRVAEKL